MCEYHVEWYWHKNHYNKVTREKRRENLMKKMKKIYAVLLIVLMLFSYMPPLMVKSKAATIDAKMDLVSTELNIV